jgi:hypothetical protein
VNALTECLIFAGSNATYLGVSWIVARVLYRHGQSVELYHDMHGAKFYGLFWWVILPMWLFFWLSDKAEGFIKGKD